MQTSHRGCEEVAHDGGVDPGLRRGPWTVDEDLILTNYIAMHGEGRWNSLAHLAGLKRTGKSCRLRWLNYLRPDVRRGNLTSEEQLLILELHLRWGNRWSKIAQYLPGRTDNEIKNYWRTRVQKHARQLQCDVNSKRFRDMMRYLWMPRLVERIRAASASTPNDYVAAADGIGRDDHLQMPPPPPLSSEAASPENCTSTTNDGSSVSESITTELSPQEMVQATVATQGFNEWATGVEDTEPNLFGGLSGEPWGNQYGTLEQDFSGFDQNYDGIVTDNFWSMDSELWSLQEFQQGIGNPISY